MTDFPQPKDARVGIQKSTYQNIDVELLLKPFGGFKNYIKKGEQVLLKTSLLNATVPEKTVVTHPAVVGTVAKAVLRAGGIPVIGDSPSGQFTKRRLKKVYSRTGLIDLSKELGIELNYDTNCKKILIPNGKKLKNSLICNFVLNADKVIALPKIKTHSFMMMTLGTKIMFGAVPGLTKVKYHSKFIRRKDFADMLLDILSVTMPDLIIMDGIVGMEGDGPSSGTPIELGVVLASDNPVALDITVCKMLNIEPTGIPTLKQAKLRNMWPDKIDYPLLSPADARYNGFNLPSTAGYLLTGKKKPKRSPVIKDKCTACKQCVEICPKKAIRIIDKKAHVDYTKCIKCYCCHEICTYDAIKLEET